MLSIVSIGYTWMNFMHIPSRGGASAPALPTPKMDLKMDESSGKIASDSTVNGNALQFAAGDDPEWAAGKLNNCVEFNVHNPTGTIVNMSDANNAFTITWWVCLDTAATTMEPMRLRSAAATQFTHYYRPSGNYTPEIYCKSTLVQGTHINPTRNTWIHNAVVATGSSCSLYYNGHLDASTSEANTFAAITKFDSNWDSSYPLTGRVDEYKLYDSELSATEVLAIYTAEGGL